MVETLDQQKLRFNREKEGWVNGIVIWLICFLAIQIMMIPFTWLRYAGIFINVILLIILYFLRKNLLKEIKELKNGKK